jgi:hypothetical protein
VRFRSTRSPAFVPCVSVLCRDQLAEPMRLKILGVGVDERGEKPASTSSAPPPPAPPPPPHPRPPRTAPRRQARCQSVDGTPPPPLRRRTSYLVMSMAGETQALLPRIKAGASAVCPCPLWPGVVDGRWPGGTNARMGFFWAALRVARCCLLGTCWELGVECWCWRLARKNSALALPAAWCCCLVPCALRLTAVTAY